MQTPQKLSDTDPANNAPLTPVRISTPASDSLSPARRRTAQALEGIVKGTADKTKTAQELIDCAKELIAEGDRLTAIETLKVAGYSEKEAYFWTSCFSCYKHIKDFGVNSLTILKKAAIHTISPREWNPYTAVSTTLFLLGGYAILSKLMQQHTPNCYGASELGAAATCIRPEANPAAMIPNGLSSNPSL